MKLSFIALTAGTLFTLTACGSFKESFNSEFDKKFVEECVGGATQKGAPQEIASKACNCTLDKLKEGKAEDEMLLPSEEEAMTAMKSCAGEMGLVAGQ
ncbi:hypothetical protein [Sphingorhabdus lutea]|uniref:hypothetical protein n=1 Tax=Sphingorhabdus lutea TaxID=1913578 RepID=UPI000AFF8EEB|nr:hypothetical protein [Sphingorhabdus lutea]